MKSLVLFEVQSFEVGFFEVVSFEVQSFEVGSFEVQSYEVRSFEVQSFEVQSVNPGGPSGSSPLRSDGSCDGQVGRLDCLSGGQKTLKSN